MQIEALKPLIDLAAKRQGLDPRLIAAIIEVESGGQSYACRFEPGYPFLFEPTVMAKTSGTTLSTEQMLQRCSWGLMQVMGATARELGLRAPLPSLTDPAAGIEFGCLYFKAQLARYSGKTLDAIAAYNAGSVVVRTDGIYQNQAYVTKVFKAMAGGLHAAI